MTEKNAKTPKKDVKTKNKLDKKTTRYSPKAATNQKVRAQSTTTIETFNNNKKQYIYNKNNKSKANTNNRPIKKNVYRAQKQVNNLPASLKKYNFENYNGQKVKVIVVGGNEEVGRNMTIIEYQNEIMIIDLGLQFPEESMPGIDYVIPNISYLKGKEKKIKGVVITHGHFDHIGGVSHIMPQIGNPPMYMAELSAGLIKERHKEFHNVPDLNITVVNSNSKIKLGKNFNIEFFHVTHTIPDCLGVAIYTPAGLIIHTGDFKLDFTPINEPPADLQKYAYFGKQGVLALMIDSTNASEPGYQLSERDVAKEIETIFTSAPGRIIIGTFASLLSRVQIIFDLAAKYNKKVLLEGRTMKKNVEIACKLGKLKLKNKKILLEDASKIGNTPDDRLVIIGTGAQAQERAFLTRFANGEHKILSVNTNDTVVFSSSVIPGNERTVSNLKDTFAKKGATVLHYKMMDVHAGGHARQEDLKLMMRLMTPKYVVPIEQSQHVLSEHGNLAASIGFKKEQILVAANGQIMEFNREKGKLTDKFITTDYVYVDGLGVADNNQIVLRDRKMLSNDGMLVLIATIDKAKGKLIGSPDIISRGFVYMKENKKLIESTRSKIKKILNNKDNDASVDDSYLKNKLRNNIGEFLYKKTKKRPMVLPVIITV